MTAALQRKFKQYHIDNPHIYVAFEKYALYTFLATTNHNAATANPAILAPTFTPLSTGSIFSLPICIEFHNFLAPGVFFSTAVFKFPAV